MVAALGLQPAWEAVAAAAEDKIPAAQKAPLLQSIAADQLGWAAATVKEGITPEVLDLLQMLLDLMRGQGAPPNAERGTPPTGGMSEEQLRASAQAAVARAAKAQGPPDSELRDAIQGALMEMFPADDDSPMMGVWVVDIYPADSTVVFSREHGNFQIGYTFDPATGAATLNGQPAEVRRTYVPVSAEASPEVAAAAKAGMLKGLPAPQTDSLNFNQEQTDPPLKTPQRKQDGTDGDGTEKELPPARTVENTPDEDLDFKREADAFKADAQRKGLPPEQTDSLRFGEEQKDPPLKTPQRKAALHTGLEDDIAPSTPPARKTYHYQSLS
jgi:hypothetical protein